MDRNNTGENYQWLKYPCKYIYNVLVSASLKIERFSEILIKLVEVKGQAS